MLRFWRLANGLARIKLSLRRFTKLTAEEIKYFPANALLASNRFLGARNRLTNLVLQNAPSFHIHPVKVPLPTDCDSQESPIGKPGETVIFASCCRNAFDHGGWKYNGGIKELNYLVKLLRRHGYEAYLVTYDGTYEPWLIEHQPHLSIQEFRNCLKSTRDVRCISSWAIADAFINECSSLYFWDMELAYSDAMHLSTITRLYNHKIKHTAGISRTIQAWHMATFDRPCIVIPNLLDDSIWYPIETQRRHYRIGYMDEGIHTRDYISYLSRVTKAADLILDFYEIKGDESAVLSMMRSCDLFLSMNMGKDDLWGEGCPRTIIEAIAAGCVSISFDIIGNREIIQDGYNGILVRKYRPDLMAEAILNLYNNPDLMRRIQNNASSLISMCHTLEARWPLVADFLQLSTVTPANPL